MTCNKEKEVLINVIELYKAMPFLWKKNSIDYSNKEKRKEGFEVLLEVYRNFDENATIKNLKKKIENMRTCYVKELKKVIASQQSDESDRLYVPTLWYYELFDFLGPTRESFDDDDPLKTEQSIILEIEDAETQSVSTPKKQKIRNPDIIKKQLHSSVSSGKTMSSKESEWDMFGRLVGLQMKDLNKHQATIAQKIISDVLFYAKLDKLTEYSCVTNPSDDC